MAFSPVSIDPNNIDAFPGPWQHWNLSARGAVRYLFAYNSGAGFSLYRSTDSGATWPAAIDVGNYPGTISDNAILQVQLIIGGGTAGSDLIRTCVAANRLTGALDFCEFDIGSLAWSAITNIGGGFNTSTHDPLSATECASVQRFLRRDGTTIVVYQCETFPIAAYGSDTGIRQVRVAKLSGATWTELGTFGSGVYTGTPGGSDNTHLESNHYVLWTAVLDGADNLQGFMNHAHVPVPSGGSEYTGMDLVHFSVSAADVVSAAHLVEADIEQMPAVTNPNQPTASTVNGRAAVKSDSTEIAFPYGFQTNTFPAGAGAELHVARGDMSGDPLNPTWTVDVVATGEPVWDNGFANDCGATYDNPAKIALEYFGGGNVTVGYGEHALANLKAYWATGGTGKLRFVQNTTDPSGSTWTAAAQLWPDPDSGAVSLDGFDVYSSAPTPVVTITITCPVDGGSASVGVPYSKFLVVTGDTPPDTFLITVGSLPSGLTLNTVTGEISGIPTLAGTFDYTVQVTDSLGHMATTDPGCEIIVSPGCTVVIGGAPPPEMCVPIPVPAGNATVSPFNEPVELQGS